MCSLRPKYLVQYLAHRKYSLNISDDNYYLIEVVEPLGHGPHPPVWPQAGYLTSLRAFWMWLMCKCSVNVTDYVSNYMGFTFQLTYNSWKVFPSTTSPFEPLKFYHWQKSVTVWASLMLHQRNAEPWLAELARLWTSWLAGTLVDVTHSPERT